MSAGGKGSAPRPIPDREQYENNWAGIDWSVKREPEPRRDAEPDPTDE